MQGVAVLHPSQQTCVRSQRNDRVTLDMEAPLETVRIDGEKRVDQAKQLHDSLVLTQIFMALENVLIISPVTSFEGETTGALLRCNDGKLGRKACNPDDGASALVCTY